MHRDDIVNTRVSLCATAIVDFSSACDLFEKMRTRGRQVRGGGARKGIGSSKIRVSLSENSERGDLDMRMNIDRLSPNRMQFFRIRFASFARPALPLSPPFFSRGTRGHACAQNRGTKPRRCMHRYSYLNCNLHSREDARETSRREKEGVRENTRILSGGKAVSFVG